LAENAQAFMASVARSIELQQADAAAVATYKRRLIDYLERFMGDLVRRSDTIARLIIGIEPHIGAMLEQIVEREARDAAPGDARDRADARDHYRRAWQERWKGLRGWFLSTRNEPPQAELLRARARSAIPQLLGAIAALNERRSGRSDRSADFRVLAGWFAACDDDSAAGSRVPPSRSIRRGISCSIPTRMPNCRPVRRGRTRRRCAFTRVCANMAKRRLAGRCLA
jgi:uncharacterized protein (TIGR02677 family)